MQPPSKTDVPRGFSPRVTERGTYFRAYARREVALRVVLTHVETGVQRKAKVVDLGLGGARLVMEEALAVDDTVTLSFTAATLWDPLVIRGRVAWSTSAAPFQTGVAFQHKSQHATLSLFDLINTLPQEE